MATTSETVYTYTCDLCGTERDDKDLTSLYDATAISRKPGRVDICVDCHARPVADALAFLAAGKDRLEPRRVQLKEQQVKVEIVD